MKQLLSGLFQPHYKAGSRILTTGVLLPFQRFIPCVIGESTPRYLVDCEAPSVLVPRVDFSWSHEKLDSWLSLLDF